MDYMKNNTVPSEKQVTQNVLCDECQDGRVKILFLGNSITYHAPKPEIGWHGNYGMATSSRENDYVHKLCDMLCARGVEVDKCIVNVADWERAYRNGEEILESGIYQNAVDFDADIAIIRLIENCPKDNWDNEIFKNRLSEFMKYFNRQNRAKVIVTSAFWPHKCSESLYEFACENGLQFVEITDLGAKDEMLALGKFEHSGVAMHPGDLGMETIAKRLLPAVLREVK